MDRLVTMYAPRHKRCPIFLLFQMHTMDSFRDGEHTYHVYKREGDGRNFHIKKSLQITEQGLITDMNFITK
jgi:hypothetical protein